MSTNGVLSKEKLLALPANKTTTVDVPEWGSIRLRYLSGLDRAELERMSTGKLDPVRFRQRLISMSVANEDGSPMLNDTEAKLVLEKSGSQVEHLCEVILELNSIGGDSVEDAKK